MEVDRNLKIEVKVDAANEKIALLERDLQRRTDDCNLKKEVIQQLSDSLILYEDNQRDYQSKIFQLT